MRTGPGGFYALLFSSGCQDALSGRGGERTSPLEPSYSQVSPPRCPQGGKKKERARARISLPPCRRIKAVRPRMAANTLRERRVHRAKQPDRLSADRRFSNPLEDGGASLCTHASRLRDPGAALFQQNHPVTTGTRPDDYSSAESATATVSAGRSRTNPNRAILALSPNRFLAVRTILV